jgi:hypothetical protein
MGDRLGRVSHSFSLCCELDAQPAEEFAPPPKKRAPWRFKMFRSIRGGIFACLILLSTPDATFAQGWGWEGWGGWTTTPEGALAQGMGHYYQGLGIFNERTAIANSINADTLMGWNEYLHQANDEALRRYVARRRENSRNIREQNDAINTRIRDNPTVRDIEQGDALNAAVNQLTDPRVSSAALRQATAPIEASVIQEIAFRNAGAAVVIVLSHIKNVTKWPSALDTPRFSLEKKTFEVIVDQAIKEDEEGEVTSDTLKTAYTFVNRLRANLAAQPLEGNRAREEANKFVKTLAGLIRLLERVDTTEAFNQLRTIKTTTLGNLIAFMEIYNLRFGAATTPRQRAVYRDLYAQIDAVRDRVVRDVKAQESGSILSNLNPVFDFFGQLFRF